LKPIVFLVANGGCEAIRAGRIHRGRSLGIVSGIIGYRPQWPLLAAAAAASSSEAVGDWNTPLLPIDSSACHRRNWLAGLTSRHHTEGSGWQSYRGESASPAALHARQKCVDYFSNWR